MPAASRIGDMSTGHGCFPPTPINSTPAQKTYINGILASVIDSTLVRHRCGKVTHVLRETFIGSSKVFIEGRAACRIGDGIECDGVNFGDAMAEGSSNTFFGG